MSDTHSNNQFNCPRGLNGPGGKGNKFQRRVSLSEKKEITGKYRFDQDSKRFHRFQIETDVGIVGTVYIPKDMGGAKLPKRITLEYASKDS
jgi:hypothetical protein